MMLSHLSQIIFYFIGIILGKVGPKEGRLAILVEGERDSLRMEKLNSWVALVLDNIQNYQIQSLFQQRLM